MGNTLGTGKNKGESEGFSDCERPSTGKKLTFSEDKQLLSVFRQAHGLYADEILKNFLKYHIRNIDKRLQEVIIKEPNV
jgi:hypothetical protein